MASSHFIEATVSRVALNRRRTLDKSLAQGHTRHFDFGSRFGIGKSWGLSAGGGHNDLFAPLLVHRRQASAAEGVERRLYQEEDRSGDGDAATV